MGQQKSPAHIFPYGWFPQAVSPSFLKPRQGQTVTSEVDTCRRPDLVTALTGLLGCSVLGFSCPTEFFGQCLQTAHQPVITPTEAV